MENIPPSPVGSALFSSDEQKRQERAEEIKQAHRD
jgi:hypothetical protein